MEVVGVLVADYEEEYVPDLKEDAGLKDQTTLWLNY